MQSQKIINMGIVASEFMDAIDQDSDFSNLISSEMSSEESDFVEHKIIVLAHVFASAANEPHYNQDRSEDYSSKDIEAKRTTIALSEKFAEVALRVATIEKILAYLPLQDFSVEMQNDFKEMQAPLLAKMIAKTKPTFFPIKNSTIANPFFKR